MKVSEKKYLNRKLMTSLGIAAFFMFIGSGVSFGECIKTAIDTIVVNNNTAPRNEKTGYCVKISKVDMFSKTSDSKEQSKNPYFIAPKNTGFSAIFTGYTLGEGCDMYLSFAACKGCTGNGQCELLKYSPEKKVTLKEGTVSVEGNTGEKFSVKIEKEQYNFKVSIEACAGNCAS